MTNGADGILFGMMLRVRVLRLGAALDALMEGIEELLTDELGMLMEID